MTTSAALLLDADRYQLSEYELQRLERIRKNEEYLAKLGLSKTKEKMMAMTQTTPRNQKRRPYMAVAKVITPSGDERRSKRLKQRHSSSAPSSSVDDNKHQEYPLLMLSYAESDDRNLRAVEQPRDDKSHTIETTEEDECEVPRRRAPRRLVLDSSDFALTPAEKKTLAVNSMDQNYLTKFREFLVYHDKISPQNERNVMRQVAKLARGEGVRYESPKYGWPEGSYFLKGTKVTPLSDIVELMQGAADAEAKWGRDRGNGWLLSHPLKKMLLFQQFCLKNPDFLATKCRLKEYYHDDVAESDGCGFQAEEEPKLVKASVQ